MKLTGILLLITILHVSAASFGQTVTYSAKAAPLTEVLRAVEQQTGYHPFYRDEDLAGTVPVTVDLRGVPLREALTAILADQPVGFEIEGTTIDLVRKKVITPSSVVASPPGDIHGRVTDSTGAPLVGASVRVKGTKKGVSTNIKGDFVLPGTDSQAVIIVSYTSYEPQEIRLHGQQEINVRLKYSSSPLDEVHVIAYGTTTERYSVGSINKVTAEQIEAQPVPNVLQALEGQVPGLIVTQSSGLAGASLTVQIRGQNTLTSNTGNGSIIGGFSTPLFVIDGIPFAPQNSNINQLGSLLSPGAPYGSNYSTTDPTLATLYTGLSPFSAINPDDIESVEVLKDADATSIYGSRGANGVILITTKKGKAGNTEVTASVQSGSDRVARTVTMMNEQQYLQMRHEAYNNDGIIPSLSTYAQDLLLFDTTKNTNWKQQFLSGTAQYTNASLSLTGGSANDNFRLSSSYNLQKDMYPGDFGQNRMSVDAAFHHSSQDKRFFMDFHGSYSYSENNTPGAPSVLQAFELPPDYPNLLDSHGNLVWNYNGLDLSDFSGNTMAYLKEISQSQLYVLGSGVTMGYKILRGLDISSTFGYNQTIDNEFSAVPLAAQDPSQIPVSSARYGYSTVSDWSVVPSIRYSTALGRHHLSAQVGGNIEQNATIQNAQSGRNYANDALLGSIENAGTTSSGSSGTLYKRVENFIRIGDIYKNEFIVDLSGNRDATSRFGPGRQFGDFYSVAGGWIFSEWNWIKNKFPALSFGKLKASYGTTGSDAIGDYQYQANYVSTPTNFQTSRGYIPINLFNPDYGWDQLKTLNMGLEAGFFKDRIVAGVEYYVKRTVNELTNFLLPDQTGFSSVVENVPYILENKGWQFTLSTRNIQSKSFKWATTFNIAANHNLLTSYPGLSTSPYSSSYIIGRSPGIAQLVKYDGVNPQTGMFQFLTAGGKVTSSPVLNTPSNGGDKNQIVDPQPKFSGGMGNTLNYKQLSLTVFCQFAKQVGRSVLANIYSVSPPGFASNQPAFLLQQAWSKPGQQTGVERFIATGASPAYSVIPDYLTSTAVFSDASYIRVKNVQLAYRLPAAYLKVIGIKACNVNISAQNLFTITRYQGDPETQNLFTVPPMKTITVGISLTI